MPVGYAWTGNPVNNPGAGGYGLGTSIGANPDIAEAWRLGGVQGLQNQKDIAGIQAGAGISQAQIAADASKYPAMLQQSRFNSVFPWLKGQFGQATGGSASGGPLGAYAPGAGPHITVGGVYSPEKVQQQVNSTRAQNDQSTATKNAQAAAQTSGRGFGSNSPLLQSIYGQNNAANLATNTSAEQQLRYNAAQGNQQAILNSQQAAGQQYGARQNELLQARGQNAGVYNALLAALSGLV